MVASHSVLEREGAVVFIGITAVVAGPMANVGVSELAPSLRRYIGRDGA